MYTKRQPTETERTSYQVFAESARNLKESSENTDNKVFRSFLILRGRK